MDGIETFIQCRQMPLSPWYQGGHFILHFPTAKVLYLFLSASRIENILAHTVCTSLYINGFNLLQKFQGPYHIKCTVARF